MTETERLANQVRELADQLVKNEFEREALENKVRAQAEEIQKLRDEHEMQLAQTILEKTTEARKAAASEQAMRRFEIERQTLHKQLKETEKKARGLELVVEANQHVQISQAELEKAKASFQEIAGILFAEVERLRSVFPLYGNLEAKELEIETIQKALRALPPGHADRKHIQGLLKLQVNHCHELKKKIAEAEDVFMAQQQKIEDRSEQVDQYALRMPIPMVQAE